MLKSVLSSLFPPGVPAVARWRLAMFAAVLMLLVHVAWACGWLSRLGLGDGFAYASDVVKVRDDVSSVKVELLEQQIWDTRVRQCELVNKEGNDSAASAYGQRVTQLLSKYQALTGRTYPVLSCREQ
jgi:hypothetical protein